jgi:hypothetical protein
LGFDLLVVVCARPFRRLEVKPSGDAKWIEDVGGAVVRDPAGRVTGVDLRASWVTDLDLRKLLQYPNLTHLDLSLTGSRIRECRRIKRLPGSSI